jgi:hypothetical protein
MPATYFCIGAKQQAQEYAFRKETALYFMGFCVLIRQALLKRPRATANNKAECRKQKEIEAMCCDMQLASSSKSNGS